MTVAVATGQDEIRLVIDANEALRVHVVESQSATFSTAKRDAAVVAERPIAENQTRPHDVLVSTIRGPFVPRRYT